MMSPTWSPGIGYADEDVGVDEHLADCAGILVENRVVKQSEASRFQVCWQSPILRHPDLQEHSMMAAGMRYLAVPWSHLVVSVLSAGWCHAQDSRNYCAWSRASWTGPEQRRARRRGVHPAVQGKPGPSAVNRGERAPTRRSARHHPDPAQAHPAMTETDITRLYRGPAQSLMRSGASAMTADDVKALVSAPVAALHRDRRMAGIGRDGAY